MAKKGPLSGVRVLEWARYLPGPYAGLLLADLGADVVKVEEPGVGDPTRLLPPERDGSGVIFHVLNRGKRSVTLDLKRKEGVEVFRRLAARSRVLIDGHRPGVAKRLGVDWPKLRRANPKLVYCAITGYGHASPYANVPGHDVNYQSVAGAVALTGTARPEIPGVQVGDLFGAWSATVQVLAALRGKKGAFLDVSMTDAVVSGVGLHLAQAMAGANLGRPGDLAGGAPYYALYECADGKWLSLACLEPRFWQNFCRAFGLLIFEDMQFAQGDERDKVRRELEALFRRRPRDEWVRDLGAKDVPVAPVLEPHEVAANPHVRARGLVAGGTVPSVASPFGTAPRGRAPRLGEHTDEVLRMTGFSGKAIRALRESGAVA